MLAGLLGAASSLLGGLFGGGRSRYVVPDYQGIRDRSEAAGFNPLTALTQGPQGSVVTSQGMGQSIAEAGLMLANNLQGASASSKLDQARHENEKLRKKVQSLTLLPKVGGIYAQRQAVPSLRSAVGGPDVPAPAPSPSVRVSGSGNAGGVGPASGAAELAPLLTVDPLDPRRAVDNKDVPSGPGFMVVDNPYLGRVYFPSIDGDEPLDLLDAPSVGAAVPQLGYHFGQYLSAGGTMDSGYSERVRKAKLKGETYLRNRDIARDNARKAAEAQPEYFGRGSFGMPRRRLTAFGWQF